MVLCPISVRSDSPANDNQHGFFSAIVHRNAKTAYPVPTREVLEAARWFEDNAPRGRWSRLLLQITG